MRQQWVVVGVGLRKGEREREREREREKEKERERERESFTQGNEKYWWAVNGEDCLMLAGITAAVFGKRRYCVCVCVCVCV